MAKNRTINTVDIILNEYSTEEIIAWLSKSMETITHRLNSYVVENEPTKMYLDMPNLLMVSDTLVGLDKKLNGDKKQVVL